MADIWIPECYECKFSVDESAHLVVVEVVGVAQVLGFDGFDAVDVEADVGNGGVPALTVAGDVDLHRHRLGAAHTRHGVPGLLVDLEQPKALAVRSDDGQRGGDGERQPAATEQVLDGVLGGAVEVDNEGGGEGGDVLGVLLPQLHGALVLVAGGHDVVVVGQCE